MRVGAVPDVFQLCLKLQHGLVLRFCCLSTQTKQLRHLSQHHLCLTSNHVAADANSHCSTGSDTQGPCRKWLTTTHSLAHCFITDRDEGTTLCLCNRDMQCSLHLRQYLKSDGLMTQQAAIPTCEISLLSVRGSFVGLASSSKFALDREVCS